MNKTISIIILIICIIMSAFCSASEMVYAKVNKLRLKRAIENKEKNAKLALMLSEQYSSTLTAILITNNLANIAASSVATILFVNQLNLKNGELIATITMTLLILIFGEIIPKSFASTFNYTLSKIFAWPMKILRIIFAPFVFGLTKLLNFIVKKLSKKEDQKITDDELITMVDTLEENGMINEDTQELITNAIDFIDVEAIEIMVHRMDVFAFNINDNIEELLNNPDLLNYSRIPVYDETFDEIVGILNTKQLIKLHLNKDSFVLKDILTEPLYVFKTQAISDILQKFKTKHIHMAIVKDEYGGNAGILTLEDILEELVGDILDEKDKEEMEEYHKVNKDKFTVDGEMNVYDFFDLIHYDYEDDNYDGSYTTVSGWITGMLEKFPEEDDSFDFEGYRISVMRADDFTVERASIEKIEPEEKENKDE